MGFFSNAFKSVSNVAKTTVTTVKTAGYAVTGVAVIGVLVVGEIVLVNLTANSSANTDFCRRG